MHVKTVIKGAGDPGYFLTASRFLVNVSKDPIYSDELVPVMISESALSLVLPLTSVAPSSSASASTSSPHSQSNLPAGLPALAYQGGILTPMTAFGDVLITRLKDSGKFDFESHVVTDGVLPEGRKDI